MMDLPRRFLGLPAPAKLNLFLHVVGRRDDGYHELQSVFVPVDLCDTLDFVWRDDGQVVRGGDLTGPEDRDLAVRAARALQATMPGGVRPGVEIRVEKRIPVGAGLGGGSSDAATTLIALNRLWSLGRSRDELAALALGLGADVPFFLGRGAAFVEGIGERCVPVPAPEVAYVIVFPGVPVATAGVFSDPKLTRDHKRTTMSGFSAALSDPAAGLFGSNDLEAVVRRSVPPVNAALQALERHGPARMSGSGSACFGVFRSLDAAQRVAGSLRDAVPPGQQWSVWAVPGLPEFALADW